MTILKCTCYGRYTTTKQQHESLNMTYKVNIQRDLKETSFVITSTVLETTDKKAWWDKINEYRKTHWIDILETTATVKI